MMIQIHTQTHTNVCMYVYIFRRSTNTQPLSYAGLGQIVSSVCHLCFDFCLIFAINYLFLTTFRVCNG